MKGFTGLALVGFAAFAAESFGKVMMQPDYSRYARVFMENRLYGIFVFLAACYSFNRRQIEA
jgi:hypothetical protein